MNESVMKLWKWFLWNQGVECSRNRLAIISNCRFPPSEALLALFAAKKSACSVNFAAKMLSVNLSWRYNAVK